MTVKAVVTKVQKICVVPAITVVPRDTDTLGMPAEAADQTSSDAPAAPAFGATGQPRSLDQITSAPTGTSMPKRVDINEVTLAVLLTLAAFASAILL